MFTFQAARAASPQLQAASGLKRAAAQSRSSSPPPAKIHHHVASPDAAIHGAEQPAAYCFQLLQVRGIPDWANRYGKQGGMLGSMSACQRLCTSVCINHNICHFDG